MPARSVLARLPQSVRAQLHRRLVASGFGDTVAIAAWLSEKGYRVGKSALGSYSLKHRTEILDSVGKPKRLASDTRAATAALRLQCLAAAAGTPGTAAAVLKRADAFVRWVLDEPSRDATS